LYNTGVYTKVTSQYTAVKFAICLTNIGCRGMSNSNNRTDESACVIVSLFFRLIGEYIFLDLFHNVVCLKIKIKYMS